MRRHQAMITAGGGKCDILLYGVPGTGKTEFVKYLGKERDHPVASAASAAALLFGLRRKIGV